jgi:hypothetical protein
MGIRRGQDWSALLQAAGLEAPGYDEAVANTNELVAKKKLIERNIQDAKSKGGRKK